MDDAGTSAQRIRIGLTGLAFAFLLVLLGSAISRSGDEGEPATVTAEEDGVDAAREEPDEPLAKLGVAPGAERAANRAAENRAAENRAAENRAAESRAAENRAAASRAAADEAAGDTQ